MIDKKDEESTVVYCGRVKGGVVVLESPPALPEGTEVRAEAVVAGIPNSLLFSLHSRTFAALRLCVNPFKRKAVLSVSACAGSVDFMRTALFTLLVSACSLAPAAGSIDMPVSLPPGETPLTEIGIYRVSWQSYGQPLVAMPGAWMGHFEARSGISYQPWGRLLGRNALLMHSPWHVPPGKTWVDYPLALPKTTPIRLAFGIAMGPDVAVPGKSDGVTFSCYLIVDGRAAGTDAPAPRPRPSGSITRSTSRRMPARP